MIIINTKGFQIQLSHGVASGSGISPEGGVL